MHQPMGRGKWESGKMKGIGFSQSGPNNKYNAENGGIAAFFACQSANAKNVQRQRKSGKCGKQTKQKQGQSKQNKTKNEKWKWETTMGKPHRRMFSYAPCVRVPKGAKM